MPDDNLPLPFENGEMNVTGLLADLRRLINEAKERAVAVNRELTLLYWHVGDRIHKDILHQQRADYGERIVPTLSAQLTREFGRGYSTRILFNMIQFAEIFPDEMILSTLSSQLGWSHFKAILPIKDRLKRDFYAEMCRLERWSIWTLQKKIGGMLFERTTLSGRR